MGLLLRAKEFIKRLPSVHDQPKNRQVMNTLLGGLKSPTYSKLLKEKQVQTNVVPFAPVGGAAASASTAKFLGKTRGVISKGFGLIKSELVPTAKDSAVQVAGKIAKNYAVLSLGGSVYEGKPQLAGARALGTVTGIAVSPISFGMGFVEKGSKDFLNFLKNSGVKNPFGGMSVAGPTLPNLPSMPNIPQHVTIDTGMSNFPMLPNMPTNINLESPSMQTPSFSPSVSVGGGMGDMLPLLLLLAGGAGVAGYALGKRKKKKKKYKKRKRH